MTPATVVATTAPKPCLPGRVNAGAAAHVRYHGKFSGMATTPTASATGTQASSQAAGVVGTA